MVVSAQQWICRQCNASEHAYNTIQYNIDTIQLQAGAEDETEESRERGASEKGELCVCVYVDYI